MRNRIVELRTVKASALRADDRNWRLHPKSQRTALASVIERIGLVNAVIARETDDGLVLVDGHLRADLDPNAELPVLVVNLDEEEAGVAMATLDPIAALAEVDKEALSKLAELNIPIDLATLYDLPVQPRQLGDRNNAPPAPEKPKAKRGDLWQLGRHRILCGDATIPGEVEKLIDGAEVHCILTDPPYSSGGFQESGRTRGSKGTEAEYIPITNDRLSTRGYLALLKQVLSHAPVLAVYIFTDWRMWINTFDIVEASSYAVRAMIVWDKGTAGMGSGWRTQHELILCGTSRNALWEPKWPGHGNVIPMGRTGNPNHPTEKPVELIERLLSNTPFAPTIYDPFLGSGTTIIASEAQDRTCYGMEMDPGFVDVAVERWQEFTGEKAKKVTP